jgi:hypothetical protein
VIPERIIFVSRGITVVSLLSRDFKRDRHFETELLPGSKQEAAAVTNSNRLRLFSKTTAACTENH